MANTIELPGFPPVSSVESNDIVYISRNATASRSTVQQFADFSKSNTIKSFFGNPNGNLSGSTYQLCWDLSNHVLYICDLAGDPLSAVWKEVFNAETAISINQIVLTMDGDYNKPSNLICLQVEVVGAGAGSAGTEINLSGEANIGGSGGGGGYAKRILQSSDVPSIVSCAIGLGGQGGILNTDGNDGGDTSFGTLATATGGKKGVIGTSLPTAFIKTGGAAGEGTIGDILVNGDSGYNGIYLGINTSDAIVGGNGGNSYYGKGGIAYAMNDPTGYGSGGQGTASIGIAQNGVSGRNGVIILTEFLLI